MFGLTMPLDCTSYFLRFRFDVSFFIFVLFSFVDLILTHLSCSVNTFFEFIVYFIIFRILLG